MKFTRQADNSSYFISAASDMIVFVPDGYPGREFDLAECFTATFNSPFLLVFSYKRIDFNNADTKRKFNDVLRGLTTGQSKWLWLDNPAASTYSTAKNVHVTRHKEVDALSVNKGGEISGMVALRKAAADLHVTFDAATTQLILKNPSGTSLKLSAGGGDALFDQAAIQVLKGQARKEGAIIMERGAFSRQQPAVQAVTPYVIEHKIGEDVDPVTFVSYLDDQDLKAKCTLDGVYFPYPVESEGQGVESLFNLKTAAAVKSNLIDKKGRQLAARELSRLTLTVGRVGLADRDSQFYLIPRKGSELEFDWPADSAQVLLGRSGTEALAGRRAGSLRLKFEESAQVLVDTRGNGIKELKSSPGLTVPSLPNETDYFLDSEKAALFNNSDKSRTAADGNSREVEYDHIKAGGFAAGAALYVIPTLSFRKKDDDLLELEKVFATQRAGVAVKTARGRAGAGSYITPQGFLKSGDAFDFIKKGAAARGGRRGRGGRALAGAEQFTVVSNHRDFNLSISRDEVFFVVTSKVLRDAGKVAAFDIFFGVRNFGVNLLNYEDLPDDKDAIVIFKYSKRSFDELLADTSRWTNSGVFNKGLNDVKKLVQDYLKELKGDEYEYLRRLRTDDNWNGVILLDVPIADSESLPQIFKGLAASQNLGPDDAGKELSGLTTKLRFQFVAFPVNKTSVNSSGLVEIKSTSFYGLIDYDLLPTVEAHDYGLVRDYFNKRPAAPCFALTKLLVKFDNSEITRFKSFAFIHVPGVFEDRIDLGQLPLSHKDMPETGAARIKNLIRLDGNYQRNSAGGDEFNFAFRQNLTAKFVESIVEKIVLTRASFTFVAGSAEDYRFDFDGGVTFNKLTGEIADFLDFEKLEFQNIGFKFKLSDPKGIGFDLSDLIALPTLGSRGKKGFFSSFPLKFNRFQLFKIEGRKPLNFDFFSLPVGGELPDLGKLFGLVFDFDLGSLGNLRALKGLKAELLLGWSKGKGLRLGFKLQFPSSEGVDVDFGTFKLFIEKLNFGKFKPEDSKDCTAYFIRLVNVRLKLFSIDIPPEDAQIHGILIANLKEAKPKIAWLVNYNKTEGGKSVLRLGVGQRMGPLIDPGLTTVKQAIDGVRSTFSLDLSQYKNCDPLDLKYQENRNWIIASEGFLPENWAEVLDFSFIFNDPVLYGAHLGLKGEALKGLMIDILYKKLSETLGVWSLELKLPDQFRTIDMGGGSLTIPNIGIEIYTDGGWKLDVGFPRGADFSRSCLLQIRPYVGWAGMYLAQLNNAGLSLFGDELPRDRQYSFLQSGLAVRVGLGAYIQQGPFNAGASISVYGILEGAFAFERDTAKSKGLDKLFPDHFALVGRMGVIVEVVGYVEFSILKATVRVVLRQEVGMRLLLIEGKLRPVPLYIEGSVSVEVSVTLRCFKIFGRKICITIHLSFSATIRFQYTLGGDSPGDSALLLSADVRALAATPININSVGRLPLVYVPAVTKTKETATGPEELLLVHGFAIPFFGVSTKTEGGKKTVVFSKKNLFRDTALRIFGDLIEGLRGLGIGSDYESLRSVLLTGRHGAMQIEVNFPNYRPWFIRGQNLAASDDLLRNVFLFDDGEITEFRKNGGKCDSPNNAECPFRVIPAPISPKIAVGTDPRDLSKFVEISDFKLTVKNLVKNKAVEEVSLEVAHSEKYTQEQIDHIDTFFDNYKTQFLDRTKQGPAPLDATKYDLREKAVIPQFFKLLALLTLEAFRGDLVESKPGQPNPMITLEDLTKWDMSRHLEALVGQLNYFYNCGLRLPDQPAPATTTAALTAILGQRSAFTEKSAAPHKDAAVTVSPLVTVWPPASYDLTADVFGATDAERNEVVGEFKASVDKYVTNQVNLGTLKDQFDARASGPADPYERRPVRLAVQNSPLKVSAKERFFQAPEKIFRADRDGHFRFRLYLGGLSDGKKTAESVTTKAVPCANVEMKVRAYELKVGAKVTTALEIVNVRVEDLNLINQIRGDRAFIDTATVSLYRRRGNDYDPLIASKATVVKTNLSTKTRPPLIGEERLVENVFITEPTYVADSTRKEMADFVRLVWEGLTTNSGGYFLLPDKEALGIDPDPAKQHTVVLSFELPKSGGEVSNPFAAFCNYLRVTDDDAGDESKSIFGKLDKNSHHLFMDLLTLADDPKTGEPVAVDEYHSKIPAHCLGFQLSRTTVPAQAEYSHYLPLEFELSGGGETLIKRDEVLPLMPSEGEGGASLKYGHVTPLLKYKKEQNVRLQVAPGVEINIYPNVERYKPVGQTFAFKFGVRDSYGFRAAEFELEKLRAYEHVYFDKLVPVESWPLISFSFWLSDEASEANEFKWKLTASIAVKDIAPLVGVKPEEIDAAGNVSEREMGRIAGGVRSVLENLYTVAAQLADDKAKAEVTGYASGPEVKRLLRGRVDEAVKAVVAFVRTRNVNVRLDHPADSITFSQRCTRVAEELAIEVKIWRPHGHRIALDARNLWEYEAITATASRIKPANLKLNLPERSSLKELSRAVREKRGTAGRFSLAISADEVGDRQLFIIDQSVIKRVRPSQPMPLTTDSYFGIKPYSNQLWSGTYELKAKRGRAAAQKSFVNVDLDAALRIVLARVDELLGAQEVLAHPEAGPLNDLISSKKALVERQLSNKVANVNRKELAPPATDEFRNLLLDRLKNFYAYDGLIALSVPPLDALADYRLTINLDAVPNYNVISSKVGRQADGRWGGDWVVLFDQVEIEKRIALTLTPQVTYLERDIKQLDGSDIASSKWLQLLEPVALDPIKVDGGSTNPRLIWPRINRVFPARPVIIRHVAAQDYIPDPRQPPPLWDKGNLGKWRYELGVKDQYEPNDIIEVTLQTKSVGLTKLDAQDDLFRGFIAYWSEQITEGSDFKREVFIDDLHAVTRPGAPLARALAPEPSRFTFNIEKTGDAAWEVRPAPGSVLTQDQLKFPPKRPGSPEEDKSQPVVFVVGLNFLLDTSKIVSVMPQVRVGRNQAAGNPDFRYMTETVEAATWATPHLSYLSVIDLGAGKKLDDVFNDIPDLPFKATARYAVIIGKPEDAFNDASLPQVPVRLMEFNQGKPKGVDAHFDGFENGNPCLTLTIYNVSEGPNDLPIFHAEIIKKRN